MQTKNQQSWWVYAALYIALGAVLETATYLLLDESGYKVPLMLTMGVFFLAMLFGLKRFNFSEDKDALWTRRWLVTWAIGLVANLAAVYAVIELPYVKSMLGDSSPSGIASLFWILPTLNLIAQAAWITQERYGIRLSDYDATHCKDEGNPRKMRMTNFKFIPIAVIGFYLVGYVYIPFFFKGPDPWADIYALFHKIDMRHWTQWLVLWFGALLEILIFRFSLAGFSMQWVPDLRRSPAVSLYLSTARIKDGRPSVLLSQMRAQFGVDHQPLSKAKDWEGNPINLEAKSGDDMLRALLQVIITYNKHLGNDGDTPPDISNAEGDTPPDISAAEGDTPPEISKAQDGYTPPDISTPEGVTRLLEECSLLIRSEGRSELAKVWPCLMSEKVKASLCNAPSPDSIAPMTAAPRELRDLVYKVANKLGCWAMTLNWLSLCEREGLMVGCNEDFTDFDPTPAVMTQIRSQQPIPYDQKRQTAIEMLAGAGLVLMDKLIDACELLLCGPIDSGHVPELVREIGWKKAAIYLTRRSNAVPDELDALMPTDLKGWLEIYRQLARDTSGWGSLAAFPTAALRVLSEGGHLNDAETAQVARLESDPYRETLQELVRNAHRSLRTLAQAILRRKNSRFFLEWAYCCVESGKLIGCTNIAGSWTFAGIEDGDLNAASGIKGNTLLPEAVRFLSGCGLVLMSQLETGCKAALSNSPLKGVIIGIAKQSSWAATVMWVTGESIEEASKAAAAFPTEGSEQYELVAQMANVAATWSEVDDLPPHVRSLVKLPVAAAVGAVSTPGGAVAEVDLDDEMVDGDSGPTTDGGSEGDGDFDAPV